MTRSHMENRAAGQLGPILTLWTWFEANRRRVIITAGVVVAVAFVGSLIYYARERKAVQAAEALSDLLATGAVQRDAGMITPERLLALSTEHAGTEAAVRAQFQAASVLFTEGKYAEAQTQFQRFLAENPEHAFVPQATYGVAAALEAQGKSEEAARAYKQLVDRFKSQGVGLAAASALGRILESQGKYAEARPLFEEVARGDGDGMLGGEARLRLAQIQQKLPPPAPPTVGTNAP